MFLSNWHGLAETICKGKLRKTLYRLSTSLESVVEPKVSSGRYMCALYVSFILVCHFQNPFRKVLYSSRILARSWNVFLDLRRLNVSKHIVAHASFHGCGLSILELHSGFSSIASETLHLQLQLLVEFGLGFLVHLRGFFGGLSGRFLGFSLAYNPQSRMK
jgi:hypothetical protein